jgi:hypothetical protein
MIDHCITVDFEDEATEEIDDINFNSDQSLLGHDIVIIDASRILRHYRSSIDSVHNGRPYLSRLEPHGAKLRRDITRRKAEVKSVLASGGIIIITTPPDTTVYTDAQDQTGLERGMVRLDMLNPLSILPVSFVAETSVGKSVAPMADEPFKTFFDENAGKLRYDGSITEIKGGTALAMIRSTARIVGAHFRVSNGHVLILPRSNVPVRYTPDQERIGDQAFPYFRSLLNLASALIASGAGKLPPWASHYLLPAESDVLKNVESAQAALRDADSRLAQERARLEKLQTLKRLFCSDGRPLEEAVEESFRELGFSIEPTEPNRADIIARYRNSVVAVEVKGVTKSGAEHQAAELEKWVSSYNAGRGKRPKGILVVNAFKNKPLIDRAKLQSFPDQMLKWSVAREHCLLTGLQLLGITLRARQHPSEVARLRKSILDCVGRYPDFADCTTFLSTAE